MAAAYEASPVLVSLSSDFFQCPVCLLEYNLSSRKPLLLSCFHSICKICINNLPNINRPELSSRSSFASTSGYRRSMTNPEVTEKSRPVCRCPVSVCRSPTKIPPKGLQENFYIINVLESKVQKRINANDKLALWCNGCSKVAVEDCELHDIKILSIAMLETKQFLKELISTTKNFINDVKKERLTSSFNVNTFEKFREQFVSFKILLDSKFEEISENFVEEALKDSMLTKVLEESCEAERVIETFEFACRGRSSRSPNSEDEPEPEHEQVSIRDSSDETRSYKRKQSMDIHYLEMMTGFIKQLNNNLATVRNVDMQESNTLHKFICDISRHFRNLESLLEAGF